MAFRASTRSRHGKSLVGMLLTIGKRRVVALSSSCFVAKRFRSLSSCFASVNSPDNQLRAALRAAQHAFDTRVLLACVDDTV